MRTKTVLIIVLIILFAILLIQNSGMAALKFYLWNIYAPQFILVFLVFCLGFLAGFLTAKTGRKKDQRVPSQRSTPSPLKPQA
ncbi:MAG: LapA family protein [Candidatus Aminicenantes bacterium]|jgi:uncharacterized integral membrane protein|nr:LapA family protein [Candidatus Aminicenantes bacterium]